MHILNIVGNPCHEPSDWIFCKKFDGQFQNPKTEKVFDFKNQVMEKSDPLEFIKKNIVYYPPENQGELYTIFISGLGQTKATSSERSRRYAERLRIGIVNLNNASYLKQNPILTKINPFLDWIDAAIHRLGLSGSPVIDNCAQLILHSINHNQVINFSADSHGTILLGRGLRAAKKKFILNHTFWLNFQGRRYWEKRWETLSQQLINVFTFGNGYKAWVKGPKYIMVFITGDPLVSKVGIRPENVQKLKRSDLKFLAFDPIFDPGDFEAHNMMYTIELLRQSFLKNNLDVGDFVGLFQAISRDRFKIVTATEAQAEKFPWPEDMEKYTWDSQGSSSKILAQISQSNNK